MRNEQEISHAATMHNGIPQTIEDVDRLSGRAFEHFAASLLRSQGYKILQVTPASGDYGTDIVAERDAIRYSVQVKCWKRWVNPDAVREALRGKSVYGCDEAMVIANRTFMPLTQAMADQHGCTLIGRDILSEWIQEHAINMAVKATARQQRQRSAVSTQPPQEAPSFIAGT